MNEMNFFFINRIVWLQINSNDWLKNYLHPPNYIIKELTEPESSFSWLWRRICETKGNHFLPVQYYK